MLTFRRTWSLLAVCQAWKPSSYFFVSLSEFMILFLCVRYYLTLPVSSNDRRCMKHGAASVSEWSLKSILKPICLQHAVPVGIFLDRPRHHNIYNMNLRLVTGVRREAYVEIHVRVQKTERALWICTQVQGIVTYLRILKAKCPWSVENVKNACYWKRSMSSIGAYTVNLLK